MKFKQIFTLINGVSQEVLGETAVVNEDLSNVVAIGKQIIDTDNIDNYVKKLVNHIGKVLFVDRVYAGSVPSLMMDSWEFGSILEKISTELPEAQENDSFNLTDGETYNQDVFYQPKVEAKFFNSKVTFDIPLSFTELQVKESFSNKEQLNGFISMLFNAVENSMTVKLDALIMRTINNMTAETVINGIGDGSAVADFTETSVKAVNLLTVYNAKTGKSLTAANALSDSDFIRYSTYIIGLYSDRLSKISTLFNVEGKERFTPKDKQITVLLSDFSKASETMLLSNVFNEDKLALPKHDSVPYWQGSGLDYDFDSVSKLDVKTSAGNTLSMSGILGVMFDRDSSGVTNLSRRVTTNYNAKAEFFTNFYKFDAGYYNDLGENFVVFFIADASGV